MINNTFPLNLAPTFITNAQHLYQATIGYNKPRGHLRIKRVIFMVCPLPTNTPMEISPVAESNSPPRCSCTELCALSSSLRARHWYMPASSLWTFSITMLSVPWLITCPSFSHVCAAVGCVTTPVTRHLSIALAPTSTVSCPRGCIITFKGDVTWRMTSTCSTPAVLLATHTHLPASSPSACWMIRHSPTL